MGVIKWAVVNFFLKKETAIHTSILAWKLPWTEKRVHGVIKSRA